MRGQRRRRRKRKNRFNTRKIALLIAAVAILIVVIAAVILLLIQRKAEQKNPQELLVDYMQHVSQKEYSQMYEMLEVTASGNITQEDFIERNTYFYDKIEMKNLKVEVTEYTEGQVSVGYQTSFDTVAGKVSFENTAYFIKGKEGYQLAWNDGMLFPGFEAGDEIGITTQQAERGEILDRNGRLLGGKGVASSVGIVPGKLENQETAITQIAELLEIAPEVIQKNLEAKWVKDDSFVPIKTIAKVEDIELLAMEPDETILAEKELQDQLLSIPGVMITDTQVRAYPLGKAAAHLTGYVQKVTAEDLEKHPGEGYTENSVIGRSGMEVLFEKQLKGRNGCSIYSKDAGGNKKVIIASVAVENGENIKLTIDAQLQTALYEQYKEDKSCSVAMDPFTGEVLALTSTPSYNSNDFILGMSQAKWDLLNNDENKPLYNRFRQVWCPGSTFKPVTASIGLETGAITPTEDFGNEGLSWQKDASWGSYQVTTLYAYEPVILENALIYSDNIYFAKTALKIGANPLKDYLQKLGFGEKLPFEITMSTSQYSNSEGIETEIQLADSGYGQGQMLVNPLHLASIYTAFCNEGNMIKPYLVYQPQPKSELWIKEAFSVQTANTVLAGMEKVINDSNGSGYGAHREDILLAGKTGTAEIKASKEDNSGTELGWFAIMTPEKDTSKPILIVTMVEDVKGRGGSGYVVDKSKQVLGGWLTNIE